MKVSTKIHGSVALAAALGLSTAIAGTAPGSLTFSSSPLLRSEGRSEPAISIGADGTMAVTGLQWLFDPAAFGTLLWTGPFGSVPTIQGLLDANLQKAGKTIFGSGDADVDLGANGTLHATSLIFLIQPSFKNAQLGVLAVSCPKGTSGNFDLNRCTRTIIDTADTDRPWITSDGSRVYISYHDSKNSSLIHVQRSDDDGQSWQRAGDPITGQGVATGDATFNNDQGPIVADPFTHNVYAIYAAGEAGIQKATSATFNNIYVARSSDQGKHWQSQLVYHAPLFTALNNIFPALAADPANGQLFAAWSDGRTVFFSTSGDQGAHWSVAVAVNAAPASTAIFPWVAAYGGTADVVYYATTGASTDDPSAVWNVYLAQTSDGGASFAQSRVSSTPNHVGVVCTEGAACISAERTLLDLFEVSINPRDGRAAIIYTDDTLTTTSSGDRLPQIVLSQQN